MIDKLLISISRLGDSAGAPAQTCEKRPAAASGRGARDVEDNRAALDRLAERLASGAEPQPDVRRGHYLDITA